MYIEVYPDVVFLINFCMDLLLIFLLKKVNKKKSAVIRMVISATAGACSAVLLSIYPFIDPIIKIIFFYGVTPFLMIFIAFGKLKLWDMVKQWIILNLITYFVGGFINSVYYHTDLRPFLVKLGQGTIFSDIPVAFIFITAGFVTVIALTVLWLYRMYQLHRPLIYDVELILKDRRVKTKGLMDTGNCLYDPIRGKPVMIMENTLMDELMSPEIKQDMELAKSYMEGKISDISQENYIDKMASFSFIPYRSVGKSGMLLGIRLDKVMIYTDKETICNEKVTAAICDNPLTSKKDYHVILHKGLL